MKGWRRIGIVLSAIWFFGFVIFTVILAGTAAQAQSLQEQGMCAAQAQKAFQWDTSKWDLEDKDLERFSTMNWEYQSHYNTKLKHCFILTNRYYLHRELKSFTSMRILYDAFEPREYAAYVETKGKIPHKLCELKPTYDDLRYCNSEWEFNAFVAEYMNQ